MLGITLTLAILAGLFPLMPGAVAAEAQVWSDGSGVKLVSTNRHSLAIKNDGSLWAWGENEYGQLGGGSAGGGKPFPSQVKAGTKFISAAAGWGHSLAVDDGGGLWAWGDNQLGQLGGGTLDGSPVPVKIGDGFLSVAAGQRHSLALDENGGLWAWGDNQYCQLGDGTDEGRLTPVPLETGALFKEISSGDFHNMALDTLGRLWIWGSNGRGQLGYDIDEDNPVPSVLMEGTLFTGISAGTYHSLAIDADGCLWSWGSNSHGQLGNGTAGGSAMPQVIMDGITAAAAGWTHSTAIDENGGAWAWGGNWFGQLGNGSLLGRLLPVRIGADDDWLGISARYHHTMAIKTDGTLWGWGDNWFGQLGDGTYIDRIEPVRIWPEPVLFEPLIFSIRPVEGTPAVLKGGDIFRMEVFVENPDMRRIGAINNLTVSFDYDVLEWALPNPAEPYSYANMPFVRGPAVGSNNSMELIMPDMVYNNRELHPMGGINAHFNFSTGGSSIVLGAILILDFKVKNTAPAGDTTVILDVHSLFPGYMEGTDYHMLNGSVTITPLYGDVNGDGVINSGDVTMLKYYIASSDRPKFRADNPTFNFTNARVAGGADASAADVSLLQLWIATPVPDRHLVVLGP
jgi:alpha-tubulin suppressor-like RCC1 family protein